MSEPIRVLHMIGSLNIGGSQAMIINLHKVVDRSKVQFDYVIDHSDHLHFAPIVEKLGGKIFTLPTFKGYNFLDVTKAWKRFFKEHPEYKILHSHVRSYASLYLPIARKAGLKTIIHSHSTSNGKGVASVVKRIMQYSLRFLADYFFACSKESGIWLFGKNVAESEKFHILRNAIDIEKYQFNPKVREEYRKQLGLGGKKAFIHVGRFHPAKNHTFLLNLFAEIHKRDDNTVLLLAGDGALRSAIERQIAELELQDSVVLLGNRSDVPNLLQVADCFLFPSLWEGLPVTVIEAQAAGLPVVCSDSITKEVVVTDLVEMLPLNQSLTAWVDAVISKTNIVRNSNIKEAVIAAGYDIHSSARWLEMFYGKISRS